MKGRGKPEPWPQDEMCERLRDRLLTLPFHYILGGKSWGVELVEVDRMIREEFARAESKRPPPPPPTTVPGAGRLRDDKGPRR